MTEPIANEGCDLSLIRVSILRTGANEQSNVEQVVITVVPRDSDGFCRYFFAQDFSIAANFKTALSLRALHRLISILRRTHSDRVLPEEFSQTRALEARSSISNKLARRITVYVIDCSNDTCV